MADSGANTNGADDSRVTGQQWYWTALSAMASYIDAGSIVAIAAGLALWADYLSLSTTTIGLLAAFGPNAMGAALGAVVGGRLGDRLGRKRIYQYDLLLYAFGTLWMVFAFNTPMLFIGTFLVGVAVGADVPTSLALVGELAPSKARGKLMGLTQVAWSLGPIITLVLALVLAPYGLLGIRIIFLHLFVVAMVTWYLRQGLTESATWTAARDASGSEERDLLAAGRLRNLFSGYTLKAMIFTAIVYTFWNLAAGTYGFFLPYFLRELGASGQAGSVALQCLWFTTTLVFVVLVFMRFGDGRYRRLIWGVGAACQILAFLIFVFYPLDGPQGASIFASIANVVLFGIGAAIAGEPHYKVWSQEVFPTMLRTTAQGITFAFARFCLGIWSFLVPVIAAAGFSTVALILVIFLSISGVVGFLFMPNTAGRTLEELEAENYGGARPAVAESGA
ncbi:MAG: Predicted L-rhamnose permease RhaY [uncultured Rubrobacteraceae bacterium]|uniref:Predicted L-rhamnose permease RhaY n=1 Tax=uncultured Rubrobacteraceae bacterium TaxID=349277 RepID=A0A6J4TDU0_9ACTN|nr:MAG: Predicted L-rhamnose permease RhaY [uncultured Rubrobacteraceae bacterium]